MKKKYINDVNYHLMISQFDYIPFLFEPDKEYEVDEIKNSLIISNYEKHREFCIKGLDMKVIQDISFYNITFLKRRRRVYFSEQLFIIQN